MYVCNAPSQGGNPSYLVVGGLVFVALSREYLQSEYHTDHMDDYESWAEDFRILALSDTVQNGELKYVLQNLLIYIIVAILKINILYYYYYCYECNYPN